MIKRIFKLKKVGKRFYTNLTSDQIYYQQRLKEIEDFEKNSGKSLYPSKFNKSTISFQEFKENFKGLNAGEKNFDIQHTIIGRISHKRESSSKLYFYDLEDSSNQHVQIMATQKQLSEGFEINKIIRKGDIVSFTGVPGKTGTGREVNLIFR